MSNDPILPPDSNSEPSEPSATSPASSSATPATGDHSQATPLSVPPNIAAGLSVVTFGVAGIAFLILEKHNRFVRFWAMQSIFFGVSMIILGIVAGIVLGVLAHLLLVVAWVAGFLFLLVRLAILVLWIVMLIQSFSGKEWEIPILGKMAREQLAKTGPV